MNQSIPNIPDKPDVLVNSSSVLGYSYNPESLTLLVWFKGRKSAVHVYYRCYPTQVRDVFMSGGSIGSKFRKQIGQAGLLSTKLR